MNELDSGDTYVKVPRDCVDAVEEFLETMTAFRMSMRRRRSDVPSLWCFQRANPARRRPMPRNTPNKTSLNPRQPELAKMAELLETRGLGLEDVIEFVGWLPSAKPGEGCSRR